MRFINNNNCGVMALFPVRTRKFIEKLTLKHGDKLEISQVQYNGLDSPVLVKCYVHGYFEMKPRYLMKYDQPCAQCRADARSGVVTVCSSAHEILLPAEIRQLLNHVFRP